MRNKTNWYEYDEGLTVGTVGEDGGIVARDEENAVGARLTLEEEGSSAPFVVTCSVYGWLRHARYFVEELEAENEFEAMKEQLDEILETLPPEDGADEEEREEFAERLAMFVEEYP